MKIEKSQVGLPRVEMQLKYIKSLVPSGLKLYSAVHWRSQVRL